MRRTLVVTAAILVALPFLFAWYALAARSVLHGPVDERTLAVSIDREAAISILGNAECDPGLDRCTVHDDSGGGIVYDVVMEPDGSCWDARLRTDASSEVSFPPDRLSGCVHLWQWELLG